MTTGERVKALAALIERAVVEFEQESEGLVVDAVEIDRLQGRSGDNAGGFKLCVIASVSGGSFNPRLI